GGAAPRGEGRPGVRLGEHGGGMPEVGGKGQISGRIRGSGGGGVWGCVGGVRGSGGGGGGGGRGGGGRGLRARGFAARVRTRNHPAPLAQLDRASASGAEGQRVESSVARRNRGGGGSEV